MKIVNTFTTKDNFIALNNLITCKRYIAIISMLESAGIAKRFSLADKIKPPYDVVYVPSMNVIMWKADRKCSQVVFYVKILLIGLLF